MRETPTWRRYLRFLGSNPAADVEDELEFHFTMRVEDLMRRGLSESEAHSRAEREFGDVEKIRSELREIGRRRKRAENRARGWESLKQDLHFAARTLRKSPGFTAVAVLTLALGIGANGAIFSVVNGVLLRGLPFEEPERLVMFGTNKRGDEPAAGDLSPPDYMSLREHSRAFEDVIAFSYGGATLTSGGDPERLEAAWVGAGFFELFGAVPLLGRAILPEENQPGNTAIAVLSYGLWQQRFGGDPEIIGKTITLNGVTRTVVGVAQPGFGFPENRALWVPLPYDEDFSSETANNRRAQWLNVVGRLRPGVQLEQAASEVRALSAGLEEEFPQTNTNMTLAFVPLHEVTVGDVRTPLLVLLGAVGLVLLIACANVASLLLARASTRQGEIAVRTALGAGRGRLVRQLLTESMLLGLIGGALGLLLAYGGTALLVALRPEGIPRMEEIGVDAAVVAFTLAVSLFTGVIFGLVPALQITRPRQMGAIKQAGRGMLAGRQGQRARSLLVVAEMALAVMLLIGAGLLVRSFLRLQQVDPGFQSAQALAFDLELPSRSYPEDRPKAEFFRSLLEQGESLPGVRSAGAVSLLPMGANRMTISFAVEGKEEAPPGEGPVLEVRVATPDYFRTMGIPVLRGRAFAATDREDAPQVVLINQTAAEHFFPNQNPIGQRIRLGWDPAGDGTKAGGEVVGVIGNVRQLGPNADFVPEIYLPHAQVPEGRMSVIVRTAGDPLALTGALRDQVRTLDPNLALSNLRTLEQVVALAVAQPRFYTLLLTIFAAVALALAAVGIFGVMSYTVTQRTREIGIRVALGANTGGIVRMVVGRALRLALLGVAAGLLGALLLTRLLESLLFGVTRTDPLTFIGVAITLAAVALLASYIPGRRATRVDPMVALRAE